MNNNVNERETTLILAFHREVKKKHNITQGNARQS